MVGTLAPERYREAHIPGALNIAPERIKELAPQLLPDKDAEIVTYCANTHFYLTSPFFTEIKFSVGTVAMKWMKRTTRSRITES